MNRYKILRLPIFVLVLSLVAGSGLAHELQAAESDGSLGVNANLAADATWFISEIDTTGDIGLYTSITIDPATNITYVSYYDYTNKTLRLAMNGGFGSGNCGPDNSWLCQTVDSTYGVGTFSSIDINPINGEIGIAYYDATDSQLKYAHGEICATCTWSIDIIDKPITTPSDSLGRYASLKYHSDGTAYIAYFYYNDNGLDALVLASAVPEGEVGNCGYGSAAGEWQCDFIHQTEGVGQYASLALDGDGNTHIAYYDATTGDLWYATNGSGTNCGPMGNTWHCIPVDSSSDVGQHASMYVDSGNHFHIAYYDATANKLKYAVDVGSGGNCGVFGSAQCETIAPMGSGVYPHGISIVEDNNNYPVIAFQSDFGSLDLARPLPALGLPGSSGNCGPEIPFSTWLCETIRPYLSRVPARQADYVSIAMSESGLGTIAYYGFITTTGGNLEIANQLFEVFEPIILNGD